MDVKIRGAVRRKMTMGLYKIRWCNLNGENVIKLAEKIKIESKWELEGDANKMWEEIADCIRRSAKEVLGVSKRVNGKMGGAWWWGEEVKEKVKAKQEKYKALVGNITDEKKKVNRMHYRIAKREAKKAVAVAKNYAYERLYRRLDSKGGEKEVFKLARIRERRIRDLSSVRCIKDEDGRLLIEDTKLQERWRSYFYNLFNGEGCDVSQHNEQLS